jgi:hypothetical protein
MSREIIEPLMKRVIRWTSLESISDPSSLVVSKSKREIVVIKKIILITGSSERLLPFIMLTCFDRSLHIIEAESQQYI